MRNCTISEYASDKSSCLEITSGKVSLKRNHEYFYQVQCQMKCTGYNWCDFFVCTSKDSFLQRIIFDSSFINSAILKASICYEKVIFSELIDRLVYTELEVEKCVRDIISIVVTKKTDTIPTKNEVFTDQIDTIQTDDGTEKFTDIIETHNIDMDIDFTAVIV